MSSTAGLGRDTLHDEVDWDETPPGPRRWPLVVAAVLLAVVAVYVVAAVWLGDRVPRGTTVSGVAVGGQGAGEATDTLDAALGAGATEPVVLTSAAGEVRTTPKALGLSVDVPATVDSLIGFSLSPATMWSHLAGGSARPAVVTVDDTAFAATVEKARKQLDAEPVEGAISLKGGKVTVRQPVTGTTTDVAGTADAVRRWWPGDSTVEVAATAVAPKVTADELARVRSEFADVAVSSPVRVSANGKTFTLAPKVFAPAVVLAADASGTITPRADAKKLAALVHTRRRGCRRRGRGEGRRRDLLRPHAHRPAARGRRGARRHLDRHRGLEGHLDHDAHRRSRLEGHRAGVHDRDREGDAPQGEDLLVHDEVPGRSAAGAQHQAGLADHQRHVRPAGRAVQHERHPR